MKNEEQWEKAMATKEEKTDTKKKKKEEKVNHNLKKGYDAKIR